MRHTFGTILSICVAMTLLVSCGKKTDDTSKQDLTQTQPADSAKMTESQSQTTQPAMAEEKSQPEQNKVEKPAPPKVRKLTIPDSTQIAVNLTDSVETNSNQVGDHFKGTIAQDVVVSGETVIPQGAVADMVITQLVKGGTLKTPPEIGFTMQSVTMPDGRTLPVSTRPFYEKGRSHTAREIGMIGGGAAAGAVIGAIAGKGKGAAVGAATGAAAGTGLAAATGRQNLVYGPGKTVTFDTKGTTVVTVPNR